MLLAIDTSAGTSVAVVDRDAGILAEHSSSDTRLHAEVIGTLIEQVLDESGVAVSALSAVAVGMGPGPFTGLRVGIAAAQTFALAAGKPVVRVVSHDAIAYAHYLAAESTEGAGPLVVATDARRRELFWSTYSGVGDGHVPIRVGGPDVIAVSELDGVRHGVPGDALGGETNARADSVEVSAGALGMLAETMFSLRIPFAGPIPLYLRAPDVTVSAGPKRVS